MGHINEPVELLKSDQERMTDNGIGICLSGGGYISGWLTAWIKRDGQNRVQKILGRRRPPEKLRVKFQ